MKIFFLTISLIVTFQFIFSNSYLTRVETIDKNYNTKSVELCIDSNLIQSSLCCLLSEKQGGKSGHYNYKI